MQRHNITSLKFINRKYDHFHLYICVGSLSLIISDQEDEGIWKILAMENRIPFIGFVTQVIIPQWLF